MEETVELSLEADVTDEAWVDVEETELSLEVEDAVDD